MKTLSMKLRNLRRRRGQGTNRVHHYRRSDRDPPRFGAVEAFKDKLNETYTKSTKAIDDHVTKKIQ